MKYAPHYYKKNWEVFGPIFLSASSLFLTFQIVNSIALFLNFDFDLLASKGFGKIIFSFLAIMHVFLFLSIQSRNFVEKFLKTSIFYFSDKGFIYRITKYFFTFFIMHWLVLLMLLYLGQISYNPYFEAKITWSLIPSIAWGLFATFFLAWSEELIFRGMFYPYFSRFWSPLPSLLVTSFCFMIVHDLANPINLFTKDWKIASGLFLLGVLINTIYVITGKLYTGMGVHMGLVAVKVILRRIPFLTFLDLRQSHIVHLLFILVIMMLIIRNKEKFFSLSPKPEQSIH